MSTGGYHSECETEDGYGVCPSCVHWERRANCTECPMHDGIDTSGAPNCDITHATFGTLTDCYHCRFRFDLDVEEE